VRGYNKPVMLAGGLGNIREVHVQKGPMSGNALN
jgi:phosphoribosylformylglycinamidine synthase